MSDSSMDDKQQLKSLADAATALQMKRLTRTSSVLYLVFAFWTGLIAAFRLPGYSGLGWLLCTAGLVFAGVYGITVKNLKSVLPFQTAVMATVAAYSAYRGFHVADRIGIVFAIAAARLAFVTWTRLRTYRTVDSASSDSQAFVEAAFSQASSGDPAKTPGLVALRRPANLWSALTKRHDDYDYRLLFDRDMVFLIGIRSFLGLRYSPLIRLIVPSRAFRIDVVGESILGRRSKVRLMLDTDPVSDVLEITPEMLEKARQQTLRLAVR